MNAHTFPATISLEAFERIDGLRNAARYDANRRSHIHGQPLRPLLNEAQHESRLFGALVDILGFAAAIEIDDVSEYADGLITACLIGQVETADLMGDAA